MRKIILAVAALALGATLARAADTGLFTLGNLLALDNGNGTYTLYADPNGYPAGSAPVTGASGNVANGSAAASLPATSAKTNYVCGFSITSTGSTAASVVSPTLTGVVTGTLTFTYASVAGVTTANQPLVFTFSRCIPASAVNTAITITLPALGAGNTNATTNIWGYRL